MPFARLAPLLILPLILAACDRSAPAIQGDFPLARLTDRVYVLHGPNEMPNPANQAFMNNPGFVLTPKGVVVVDPGSSRQVGELLLKKIATVTRDPVIAVFNSHIHGDHWLGNDAIRRAYPKAVIYAHPKMREKAAGEGQRWIELMNRLSEGAVKGTEVVAPNMGLDDGETLAVGGLHFRVHHSGQAHTDGDLMIEVLEEKVLFLGDNVVADRAARLDDGDFLGNVAACEAALKTEAKLFVPGHGRSGGREVVVAYRDWLKALYGAVKKHYAQGLSDFDMKDKVVAELKSYRRWAMFDSEIGKLVSLAYLQVEKAAF
jgi:glyoxylase-like metal-dependent hydrolase (beta-lactamase superfamily II)